MQVNIVKLTEAKVPLFASVFLFYQRMENLVDLFRGCILKLKYNAYIIHIGEAQVIESGIDENVVCTRVHGSDVSGCSFHLFKPL